MIGKGPEEAPALHPWKFSSESLEVQRFQRTSPTVLSSVTDERLFLGGAASSPQSGGRKGVLWVHAEVALAWTWDDTTAMSSEASRGLADLGISLWPFLGFMFVKIW